MAQAGRFVEVGKLACIGYCKVLFSDIMLTRACDLQGMALTNSTPPFLILFLVSTPLLVCPSSQHAAPATKCEVEVS
eukprot:1151267-Pelagomonas_calceolata.AAC.3